DGCAIGARSGGPVASSLGKGENSGKIADMNMGKAVACRRIMSISEFFDSMVTEAQLTTTLGFFFIEFKSFVNQYLKCNPSEHGDLKSLLGHQRLARAEHRQVNMGRWVCGDCGIGTSSGGSVGLSVGKGGDSDTTAGVNMGTAVPPPRAMSIFELLDYIVNEAPPTVPATPGFFSVEFKSFVDRCLKRNPSERGDLKTLAGHEWLARAEHRRVDMARWVCNVMGVDV
ncbi:dual specificity mitogen-activated protein kinase kinase 1-like, partial [Tropilaelaps mercedesae]